MRACSVEMAAAPCWSSQKPGSPIFASSSAARLASPSGSKVITDPVELGPDLLQALGKRGGVGHPAMVAAPTDQSEPSHVQCLALDRSGSDLRESCRGRWLSQRT